MNSFFLAETLKYLFLLFDDGSNFVHRYVFQAIVQLWGSWLLIHSFVQMFVLTINSNCRGAGNYIFNTEGHILPLAPEFHNNNASFGIVSSLSGIRLGH